MGKYFSFAGPKPVPLIILISAAIFMLFFVALVNLDRIMISVLSRSTGVSIEYDSLEGNLFNKSEIKGVRLLFSEENVELRAETAFMDVDARTLLEKRGLSLKCDLKGVNFFVEDNPVFGNDGKETGAKISTLQNILAIPFDSDERYNLITFKIYKDKNQLSVNDFNARSEHIVVSGDYKTNAAGDQIELEISISFSPEMSAAFSDGIRSNVLSEERSGWYGTVISYKGNPAILKALYSHMDK